MSLCLTNNNIVDDRSSTKQNKAVFLPFFTQNKPGLTDIFSTTHNVIIYLRLKILGLARATI